MFYHHTVSTEQVLTVLNNYTKKDFSKVFDQYLRTTKIPLLKYEVNGKTLSFKYERVVPAFAMPLRVAVNGKEIKITPSEQKQTLEFPDEIKTFEVNRNFYIESEKGDL